MIHAYINSNSLYDFNTLIFITLFYPFVLLMNLCAVADDVRNKILNIYFDKLYWPSFFVRLKQIICRNINILVFLKHLEDKVAAAIASKRETLKNLMRLKRKYLQGSCSAYQTDLVMVLQQLILAASHAK